MTHYAILHAERIPESRLDNLETLLEFHDSELKGKKKNGSYFSGDIVARDYRADELKKKIENNGYATVVYVVNDPEIKKYKVIGD